MHRFRLPGGGPYYERGATVTHEGCQSQRQLTDPVTAVSALRIMWIETSLMVFYRENVIM